MKKLSLGLLAALLFSACQEVGKTLATEANKGQTSAKKEERKFTSGVVTQTNDKSQVKNEITLKDGVKEGEAKSYYPSGELWKKVFYKNGALQGLAEVYDRKGNIKRAVNYKDGQKHGFYTEYFKSGKEKLQIEYFEDRPLPGLLRRDYTGQDIPEPSISIKQKGKVNTNPDVYEIEFIVDEKLKDVRFYGLKLDQKWETLSGPELNDHRLPSFEGKAVLRFQIDPGYFLTNEHYVFIDFEVKKGLRAVVKQKVNYAIEGVQL